MDGYVTLIFVVVLFLCIPFSCMCVEMDGSSSECEAPFGLGSPLLFSENLSERERESVCVCVCDLVLNFFLLCKFLNVEFSALVAATALSCHCTVLSIAGFLPSFWI